MSITSLTFFALLLATLLIYYLLPLKVRWCFLTIVSAGFVFLSSGLDMLLVLAAEVLAVYMGTLGLAQIKHAGWRRAALLGLITLVLGILFYFRDMAFINLLKQAWSALSGQPTKLLNYTVGGPIGVSYFTLSLVGYIVDVYWEKYAPEKNFVRLFLFAGYFPQLTSGPIVRYDDMGKQFRSQVTFDPMRLLHGGERILWGCFKKMVLADRANILVTAIYAEAENCAGLTWVVCLLLYALQLYTDFSGCMDIVIGASECFGITLPENFNTPFASTNMTEFWRRWHISMGIWFKDYVMYPLLKTSFMQKITKFCKAHFGRDFGKRLPVALGTSVLWIAIGLWHGGSAKYIIASGLLPGFYTVMGELLTVPFKKLTKFLHINTDCFSYRLFGRLRTLSIMCVNWIFVRSDSVAQGVLIVKQTFAHGCNPWVLTDGTMLGFGLDVYDFSILAFGLVILICVAVLHERGIHLRAALDGQNLLFRYVTLMSAIFVVLIFGVYGPGYNAAGFIYKQF